jgi:hypothetical protein
MPSAGRPPAPEFAGDEALSGDIGSFLLSRCPPTGASAASEWRVFRPKVAGNFPQGDFRPVSPESELCTSGA